MLLCYVIDSGLSTSLLLLATLIIMFYITFTFTTSAKAISVANKFEGVLLSSDIEVLVFIDSISL